MTAPSLAWLGGLEDMESSDKLAASLAAFPCGDLNCEPWPYESTSGEVAYNTKQNMMQPPYGRQDCKKRTGVIPLLKEALPVGRCYVQDPSDQLLMKQPWPTPYHDETARLAHASYACGDYKNWPNQDTCGETPALQIPWPAFGKAHGQQGVGKNMDSEAVPFEVDREEEEEEPADMTWAVVLANQGKGLSGFTTVMIKNIPEHYSQDGLVNLLISRGLSQKFDYFHMPAHSSRLRCSCGYAFLNLVNPEVAANFYDRFNGDYFQQSDKVKRHDAHRKTVITPLSVSPAYVQGLFSNAKEFIARKKIVKTGRYHRDPVFLSVPECFADEIPKWGERPPIGSYPGSLPPQAPKCHPGFIPGGKNRVQATWQEWTHCEFCAGAGCMVCMTKPGQFPNEQAFHPPEWQHNSKRGGGKGGGGGGAVGRNGNWPPHM